MLLEGLSKAPAREADVKRSKFETKINSPGLVHNKCLEYRSLPRLQGVSQSKHLSPPPHTSVQVRRMGQVARQRTQQQPVDILSMAQKIVSSSTPAHMYGR